MISRTASPRLPTRASRAVPTAKKGAAPWRIPNLEGAFARAYLDGVDRTRSALDLDAIEEAFAAGRKASIEAALPVATWADALAAWKPTLKRIVGVGGAAGAKALDVPHPRTRRRGRVAKAGEIAMAFDVNNPAVTSWVDMRTGELITSITSQQRDAVREIIRQATGQAPGITGFPPRTSATMVQNVVGLSPRYATAVGNHYQTMIAGGMPEEKALASAQAYSDRLLKSRAMTIARTETMAAANQGKLESWRQAASAGLLDLGTSVKVWLTAQDDGVCDECDPMDGEEVGVEDEFSSGDDMPPLHPNCRCTASIVPFEPGVPASDAGAGGGGGGLASLVSNEPALADLTSLGETAPYSVGSTPFATTPISGGVPYPQSTSILGDQKSLADAASKLQATYGNLTSVDYTGTTVPAANKISQVLDTLAQKYPDAMEQIKSVQMAVLDPIQFGTGSVAEYVKADGSLILNIGQGFNKPWMLEKTQANAIASGFAAPGTDGLQGIVAHEFGHAAYATLDEAQTETMWKSIVEQLAPGAENFGEFWDGEQAGVMIESVLGSYASYEPPELFAQAFAQVNLAAAPSDIAKTVMQAYEDALHGPQVIDGLAKEQWDKLSTGAKDLANFVGKPGSQFTGIEDYITQKGYASPDAYLHDWKVAQYKDAASGTGDAMNALAQSLKVGPEVPNEMAQVAEAAGYSAPSVLSIPSDLQPWMDEAKFKPLFGDKTATEIANDLGASPKYLRDVWDSPGGKKQLQEMTGWGNHKAGRFIDRLSYENKLAQYKDVKALSTLVPDALGSAAAPAVGSPAAVGAWMTPKGWDAADMKAIVDNELGHGGSLQTVVDAWSNDAHPFTADDLHEWLKLAQPGASAYYPNLSAYLSGATGQAATTVAEQNAAKLAQLIVDTGNKTVAEWANAYAIGDVNLTVPADALLMTGQEIQAAADLLLSDPAKYAAQTVAQSGATGQLKAVGDWMAHEGYSPEQVMNLIEQTLQVNGNLDWVAAAFSSSPTPITAADLKAWLQVAPSYGTDYLPKVAELMGQAPAAVVSDVWSVDEWKSLTDGDLGSYVMNSAHLTEKQLANALEHPAWKPAGPMLEKIKAAFGVTDDYSLNTLYEAVYGHVPSKAFFTATTGSSGVAVAGLSPAAAQAAAAQAGTILPTLSADAKQMLVDFAQRGYSLDGGISATFGMDSQSFLSTVDSGSLSGLKNASGMTEMQIKDAYTLLQYQAEGADFSTLADVGRLKFADPLPEQWVSTANVPFVTPPDPGIFPYPMDELKAMPKAEQLDGGIHQGKVTLTDPSGRTWLFKPIPGGGPTGEYRVMVDEITANLQALSGLAAPDTFVVTLDGKVGSIQQVFGTVKANRTMPFVEKGAFDPMKIGADKMLQIQEQQVFDWLVSNFDAHEENFIRVRSADQFDSALSHQIIGIDKGQAFRFWGDPGQAHLDYHYLPNSSLHGDSKPTIYSVVDRAFAQGSQVNYALLESNTSAGDALRAFIEKLQAIPDDQYAAMLRPYAEAAAQRGGLASSVFSTRVEVKNNVELFLREAVERKNNLLREFTDYQRRLQIERDLAAQGFQTRVGAEIDRIIGEIRAANMGPMARDFSSVPMATRIKMENEYRAAFDANTVAARGIHTISPMAAALRQADYYGQQITREIATWTRIKRTDGLMEANPLQQEVLFSRNTHAGSTFQAWWKANGIDTGGYGATPEQRDAAMHALEGRVWSDPAYLSTSVEGGSGGGGDVKMTILAPAGTRGFYTGLDGRYYHEAEFTLARGTHFFIQEVRKVGNTWYIKAVVLGSATGGPMGAMTTAFELG